jgi:hypothetical protein
MSDHKHSIGCIHSLSVVIQESVAELMKAAYSDGPCISCTVSVLENVAGFLDGAIRELDQHYEEQEQEGPEPAGIGEGNGQEN